MIKIDSQSSAKLNEIFSSLKRIKYYNKLKKNELINLISEFFLNTPYVANTLIGSKTTPETLVVNLNAVDCMTLLDYVKAISESKNKHDFIYKLIQTRYKRSIINYFQRKHFFSDWFDSFPKNAIDITNQISNRYITVKKYLNKKKDGSEFIEGLGTIERKLQYIPTERINQSVLEKLATGDLIGIFSKLEGLDVSHVGIIIKTRSQIYFRNASSLPENMKVVDTYFLQYIEKKPGIIVSRIM